MAAADPDPGVRARLRAALPAAMKAGDRAAVAALRTVLGAIDNAEAVDASAAPAAEAGEIAGGVTGLGRGEVPRRALSEDEIAAIVRREIADREEHAATFERAGRADHAARLRAEVAALAAALADR